MEVKKRSKTIYTLLSVLISISLYIGAVIVYFYAHGWRFDPIQHNIIKTGVLTVESEPFLANLYIDGKQVGRTPKSTSLPVGNYEVSVYRSGYVEWKKRVEIKEEKSTPVYPWLVKDSIAKTGVYTLQDREYINNWYNESKTQLYFLTKYIVETGIYRYELFKFDINTAFWDLRPNPKTVLTIDTTSDIQITLLPAPNGITSLLNIKDSTSSKYYLLDSTTSNTLNTLNEIDLSTVSSLNITWALDSKYLLFESDTELISLDTKTLNRYLLIQKTNGQRYIWDTDMYGYFYSLTENVTEENIYSYSLIQQLMDGTSTKILIENIPFQKNLEYIDIYRGSTDTRLYSPFTSSTQSTKNVGKVTNIKVNQDAKGIYIQTETSSYWYNIQSKKYHLISPYPSELIQFSLDHYKLIFRDTQGYNIFTFNKEDGDHTTEIGAKRIKGLEGDIQDVNWISNSLYIWYVKDNGIYIADREGENVVKVLDGVDTLKFYIMTTSREKIYTFYTIENNIYIDAYLLK